MPRSPPRTPPGSDSPSRRTGRSRSPAATASATRSDTHREWVFTPADVHVTSTVVGRGAFGEVRVAKWRNMLIACKQLHAPDDGTEGIDVASLQQEIKLLSSLRHPNLVLFLGVCVTPDAQGGRTTGAASADDLFLTHNTCILTELLPCSLYDLLETKKMTLTLPDILDIARDVANGLDYLHRHEPSAIVHRDISSKNILLGGNRAKIADLGQAKLFASSTMSRQTGMPGAMAYSAPEVLTGKYSAKIDIFSFGILLAQMCTSEYPRIDRREEQINTACTVQPLLERLIRQSVSFQPQERPFSYYICSSLTEIVENDRHYPNTRRVQPQSEIGVIARSWMQQEIEAETREAHVELDRTRSLLSAEEQRWRAEAEKADGIKAKLENTESSLYRSTEELAALQTEKETLEQQLRVAENSSDQLRSQLQAIGTDTQRINQQVLNYETQLREQNEQLLVARDTISALEADSHEQRQLADNLHRSAEEAKRLNEQLTMQLSMQVEHGRDMETRLEQALTRWKLDKDNLREETAKFNKANAKCAALVEKNERIRAEIERYEGRLQQYDDLPLPDEIKARIRDLQRDLDKSSDEVKNLLNERENLQAEKMELEELVQDKQSYIEELREDVLQKESLLLDREKQITMQNSTIELLQQSIDAHSAETSELNAQIESLRISERSLRDERADLKTELTRERRMVEILRSTANANNSSPNARAASTLIHSTVESADNDHVVPQSSSFHTADGMEEEVSATDLGIIDTNAVAPEPAMASVATAARLLVQQNAVMAGVKREEDTTDSAVKHAVNRAAEVFNPEDYSHQQLMQQIQNDAADNGDDIPCQGPTTARKAVQRVIALMQKHSKDDRYIWRGARALREIILKEAGEAKAACYASEMEHWLLSILFSFTESAVVQGHGMRLIGALAFGNDIFRRKMGEKGRQGAVQLVINALNTHFLDETVLLHSITALTNLTHNSMENRSRFVEYGGIGPLISMMIHYSHQSVKLSRQACWAVLTLSASDDIAVIIASHGADTAILNAMLHHRMDPGVQRFGCWALSNLAMASEDVCDQIKKKGVVEVCRIVLETHADDVDVVRQARNTLGVFSPLTNNANAVAVPKIANNARPHSGHTTKNSVTRGGRQKNNIATSLSNGILNS